MHATVTAMSYLACRVTGCSASADVAQGHVEGIGLPGVGRGVAQAVVQPGPTKLVHSVVKITHGDGILWLSVEMMDDGVS